MSSPRQSYAVTAGEQRKQSNRSDRGFVLYPSGVSHSEPYRGSRFGTATDATKIKFTGTSGATATRISPYVRVAQQSRAVAAYMELVRQWADAYDAGISAEQELETPYDDAYYEAMAIQEQLD